MHSNRENAYWRKEINFDKGESASLNGRTASALKFRKERELIYRVVTIYQVLEDKMNRFFGSFFGSLVGIALIGLLAFGVWNIQLPASAAPAAQATEEPADDVVCVTTEDGDDICATAEGWMKILEQIRQLVGDATAADAPANPAVDAPAAPAGNTVTNFTKCEYLKAVVPQERDGIALQELGAALANVPTTRIRVHLYPCGNGELVYDGFIVLGPREGEWYSPVTLTVPVGGAIDSYNEASYTGTTHRIGQNTIRATDGTVTGVSMTYWFWWDDNPPTSMPAGKTSIAPAAAATTSPVATPVATTAANTLTCEQPATLATREGWTKIGQPNQYGGLQVRISTAAQLPLMWEAEGEGGRKIIETDTARSLVAGVWTVYPPYSCREELGFSR